MTTPLSNRMLSQPADLGSDQRSLESLKRDAQRDPQGTVKKAAQQFEALFMQMVLKSMREATPKSGLFDSPGQDMYTGMLDQQLATKVAQSGTGLADVIARQLTRHMGQSAAGSQESGAQAPGVDRYAELAAIKSTHATKRSPRPTAPSNSAPPTSHAAPHPSPHGSPLPTPKSSTPDSRFPTRRAISSRAIGTRRSKPVASPVFLPSSC